MVADDTVYADAFTLGRALAEELVARWSGQPQFTLGCPAGRSLRSTFRALAEMTPPDMDLSGVRIVMMDEYVVDRDSGFVPISEQLPHSCRGYGLREIIGPLNASRTPQRQIPSENLWTPDPRHPQQYDLQIKVVGGIDMFLVASGASDGHVGFRGPGADLTGRTEVVRLAESTRRDNLETFPTLRALEEVPSFGVSVGLGTIVTQSKEVVMVMHGESKRPSARTVLSANGFDPAWPATFIHASPHPRIILDRAAAGRHHHLGEERS